MAKYLYNIIASCQSMYFGTDGFNNGLASMLTNE